MTRSNLFIALVVASVVVASLGAGFAQKGIPRQPDKKVIAVENVKQLLLLMDADKSGKITKQQWMAFMEAEFDRLDLEKTGKLDQAAIRQSTAYVRQARSADLGR
ncbi:MAG TPA: hypothetical protein VMX38_03735 [Verrucomicrobiae bacterium]|jgi:hypothetical protein|nr:hypothetical protein [Verrucomicrobiae bacterium]